MKAQTEGNELNELNSKMSLGIRVPLEIDYCLNKLVLVNLYII